MNDGFESWYRDLCPKVSSENWSPGPSLISTRLRVTPSLLRLTWENNPLYHSKKGWSYIIPKKLLEDKQIKYAKEKKNLTTDETKKDSESKKNQSKAKKVTYAIETCMGEEYGVFKIPHKVLMILFIK